VHVYEGIYVLYMSIALMNKTRFDRMSFLLWEISSCWNCYT